MQRLAQLSSLLLSVSLACGVACGGGGGDAAPSTTAPTPDGGAPTEGGMASPPDAAPVGDGSADGGGACTIPPVTLTHDASAVNVAKNHVLDTTKYPNAVCNDGTTATYWFRPGVGASTKRWIIYLEGGGQCGTDETCLARFQQTPGYMTSSPATEGQTIDPTLLGGIKSSSAADNPNFYDFNYVQVQYCSSDVWSGDRAATAGAPDSSVNHWHFRGRSIVDAVVGTLLDNGLAGAEQVLLVGSSAGAVGVSVHADDIAAQLPGIRFLAFSDAGFFIDYPAYDPATMTESTANPTARFLELQAGYDAWGGHGDASCEAMFTTDVDKVQCRGPSALYEGNHVTSHVFIRQSLRDDVQTKAFIDPSEQGAAPTAFRTRFSTELGKEVSSLTGPYAVFATLDTHHGVINDTALVAAAAVNGTSLTADLLSWYEDPCANTTKLIAKP